MIQYLRRLGRGGDILGEVLRLKVSGRKRVVVDFSSPNIAKHFHIGNLRSTLLGDFYCRLNRLAGHEIISLNYLGDWGTQMALLTAHWPNSEAKSRFENMKPDASLSQQLVPLMDCYVEACKLAEKDPLLRREHALNLLDKMETALIAKRLDDPVLETWTQIRKLSMAYLKEFYGRFDIKFDVWDAESNYVAEARRAATTIIDSGMTTTTREGLKIIHDSQNGGYMVLGKSTNHTSLYLTREIVATIARHERFNADSYVYVVDRAQSSHFKHLQTTLEICGRNEIAQRIQHLSFGRLLGFSTRKGIVETVEQVLEEGVDEATDYVLRSRTIKITEDEVAPVCQELAQAALIFNDIKRQRNAEYTFTLSKAFKASQKPFYLHEKYARLCSLIKNNADLVDELTRRLESDMSTLNFETDKTARSLFQCLYELDGALYTSYIQSEPSPLVNYLLRLTSCLGSAVAELSIKNAPTQQIALNRLLLFVSARNVMTESFELLGIKPLSRI